MKLSKIKNRGTLFTYDHPGWDLNIYLIRGRNYNYIIDTGIGSCCIEPILNYIKDDAKKTIIINTHYHWDHVWGNSSFEGCILISHKLCREMIQSHWDEMLSKNGNYCYGEAKMLLPDLIFEDELYFCEDNIRLFHSPGHTLDSISILDEEDHVLILGDNIGDSMEELLPSINCKRAIYRNTMLKYEQMNFDICISGHNTVLEKEIIRTILSMV
jgi:glyoxylase-like metal-dependent hydrolase (beta-lactamase superfamily II)